MLSSSYIKASILILLISVLAGQCRAADHYNVGDQLYVWSKNGLNLRSKPNSQSQVMMALPFGERVTIKEKTAISYNITGIKPSIPSDPCIKGIDPLIFKGHWIKVMTDDGIEGFVIDQYLLTYLTNRDWVPEHYELNLKPISVDTTFKRPIMEDGSVLNMKVEYKYEQGITKIEYHGGSWSDSKYLIKNATIEETLILFSYTFDNYETMNVTKNWKDEVIITDNSICKIHIKRIDDHTIELKIECSC